MFGRPIQHHIGHVCGCYYYLVAPTPYQHQSKSYLPLLNSEAHTTILSTTSTTTLKQTFTNPSSTDDIKECTYTFPLYDGVSVVRFTCKIGEKTLTGLVKEKVKAKKIFDDAVAKGETAGLLEQAPESSDFFTTKLGNIPKGQSVIVEITYIGELKNHETEGIRFTIPTKIAPRYGSGPTQTALPQNDGGGISISVDICMPEGSFIRGVQSPSHPIAVSMGTISAAAHADPVMSKASATLSLGSAALEKDFVLIVQSKDVGTPKALLEMHPTIPNHRAIMATLVPKFSLPPSRPEIVFVADRSGSMAGLNNTMLISAMKVFLKSMPAGVKFNICSFGNRCSFLWPQSKSYTSESLEEAMAHVQKFTANMGGTETFNAIKSTIDRRFSDLPLEIILLTDGDIWQQNELFDYVNKQVASTEGKIRIFPLGIGNGVSHSLIEGLARAGNGFAQAVQSGERLDNCAVRMLRGALSPHITDYTLEVKYEQKDDDFEVIEKVTEGMRVLLGEAEPKTTGKEVAKPQETISLFDPNVNPEDIEMKDAEIELPNIPYPKLLQAPHKIPSLFAFSRTTVYLLMSPKTIQRNPISVILRGTSSHGPLALEIPIEVLPEPAETIHQLAAKKAVQDLEEGRGWIYDAKDESEVLIKERFPSMFEDLVKKEAVRLGEKFQVAGKWCSFVAVAANDEEIAAKQKKPGAEEDLLDVGKDFEFIDSEDDLSAGGVKPKKKTKDEVEGKKKMRESTGSRKSAQPQAPKSSQGRTDLSAYQSGLMTLHQDNRQRRVMTYASAERGASPSVSRPMHAQAPSPQQQQLLNQQAMMSQQQGLFQPRGQPVHSAFYSSSSFAVPPPPPSAGGLFGQPQSAAQGQTSGGLFGQSSNTGFGATAPRGPTSFGSAMGNSAAPGQQSPFGAPSGQVSAFGNPAPQGQTGLFGAAAPIIPAPVSLQSQAYDTASAGGLDNSYHYAAPQARKASITPPQLQSSRRRGPNIPSKRTTKGSVDGSPSSNGDEGSEVPDVTESSSSAYVTKWANKSSTEKVLALIELQEFDGSWPAGNGEIAAILGFGLPHAPANTDAKVWITLLVVYFLELKNADEEGTWGMVVEKARDWLAASVQTGLADLEKVAMESISKA